MSGYISTGHAGLDKFMLGGYENAVITTIYGPGGSGKTSLCMLAAIAVVKSGKKVIYIDTESSFSVTRSEQIAKDKSREYLENIVFLRPESFAEQRDIIENLRINMSDIIGLIIVDSIATYYRLEYGRSNEIYETNRELGLHISYLMEISRKNKIPVLLTNQVYATFDDSDSVKIVGGDVMKYASKALIEIKKAKNNVRAIIIKKHRSLPEGREFVFEITGSGIEEIKA